MSAARAPQQDAREGTRELLGGAGRAFAARAAGAGLSFGVGVAVARALGPAGSGAYFLAVTFATIASVLGRLGLDQLVLRRTATALAAGEARALRGTARRGLVLGAAVSAALAAALFAAAPLLARLLDAGELADALRRTALAVVPLSLLMLLGELLRGLRRVGASQLVQVAAAPAGTLLAFGLFGSLFGWSLGSAAAAYATGAAVAAGLGALLWRRAAPRPDGPPDNGATTELARASLPFLGIAVLTLGLSWISVLTLGAFGDEADVGLFTAAYRTATLTSFVLIAVNSIAAPRFAALHAAGRRDELARSARQATGLMVLLALPLLIAAWVFPARVLALFGPGFEEGALCLAILATGQFVNVATGSVGVLLMMSGHERALRGNLLGAAILSLALHLLLVPRNGIVGAAIASAVTVAAMNVASLLLVRHHLSIAMLPWPPPRARRSDA